MSGLVLRLLQSIAEVPAEGWDAMLTEGSSPFVEHVFLKTLEDAGCVGGKTGWAPHHLLIEKNGAIVGAAPLYLKSHSMGEYVFDHAFANVAGRLGVDYYPKLLVAPPFAPQLGDRLLVAPGQSRAEVMPLLAEALVTLTQKLEISSAHVLFAHDEEIEALKTAGFCERLGVQFHWRRAGERTFDDYLATFDSKRRNQIRRERRGVRDDGIVLETRRDRAIDDATLDVAYRCHGATLAKMGQWGRRYMNARFFELIRDRMVGRERDPLRPKRGALEIVVAREGGRPIAAAINYAKNGRLYGRHWGALEDRRFLHFEVAYYHSIEECIARGFSTFEPGTQGEDTKGPRGFAPVVTKSAHWFSDPRLRMIVEDYMRREADAVRSEIGGGT